MSTKENGLGNNKAVEAHSTVSLSFKDEKLLDKEDKSVAECQKPSIDTRHIKIESATVGSSFTPRSLPLPSFPPVSGTSIWGSIVNPIKKLWEIPTIHLSTYYGLPNQPGRPGPVLAVFVERSVALTGRSKQRTKRPPQPKSTSTTSVATSFNKLRFDFVESFTGYSKGGSSANSTGNEEVIPEVEGVLLVTPCAIEKYQLNGSIVKRAALPEAITSFLATKIAGVGRVFLCGTQGGRVHVLKTDLLNSMLVFDTGCLKGTFLNALKRAQENEHEKVLSSDHPSQFSYARQQSIIPSVFANPPRLLAEALLAIRPPVPDQSIQHVMSMQSISQISISPQRVKKESSSLQSSPHRLSFASERSDATSETDVSTSDQLGVLNRLGSIIGDGMTPQLIEGKAMELKGDLGTEMLTEVLSRLAKTKRAELGAIAIENEIIDLNELDIDIQDRQLHPRGSPLRLSQFNVEEVRLLKELGDHLRTASAGVCSLAVKCSFGTFTEAVLAGTEEGEVFVWEVPSGRLLNVLEYPGLEERTSNDFNTDHNIENDNQVESEEVKTCEIQATHNETISGTVHDEAVLEPEANSGRKRRAAHTNKRDIENIENGKHDVFCSTQPIPSNVEPTIRSSSSFTSSSVPYVAATQVLHVYGRTFQAYVGYGNGTVAVFDLNSPRCLKFWDIPDREPIVAIELATQIGVVLVLSGNKRLSIWSCRDFSLIRTFFTNELTSGIPLSCMKVVDPERRSAVRASAILFVGCIDGSICVHRLFWDSHQFSEVFVTSVQSVPQSDVPQYGTLLPSGVATTQNTLRGLQGIEVGAPFHSIEGLRSRLPHLDNDKPELNIVLLKAFKREIDPLCPVTSLWVDALLDTAFIGDASGVVATLLPIRYLLESVTPNLPQAKDSPDDRNLKSSPEKLSSSNSNVSTQHQLESVEYRAETTSNSCCLLHDPSKNIQQCSLAVTPSLPSAVGSEFLDDANLEPQRES